MVPAVVLIHRRPVPRAESLPIERVPPLNTVSPEYVLTPVRVNAPVPDLYTAPVPDMMFEYVPSVDWLKRSDALFVMSPWRVDVVICKVPADMVVPPV